MQLSALRRGAEPHYNTKTLASVTMIRSMIHYKDGKTIFGVHQKAVCVAIECTTFNA